MRLLVYQQVEREMLLLSREHGRRFSATYYNELISTGCYLNTS